MYYLVVPFSVAGKVHSPYLTSWFLKHNFVPFITKCLGKRVFVENKPKTVIGEPRHPVAPSCTWVIRGEGKCVFNGASACHPLKCKGTQGVSLPHMEPNHRNLGEVRWGQKNTQKN